MIELALLKALSNKKSFDNYRHLLNPKTLSDHSLLILKDYEVYFNNHDVIEIDWTNFSTYFFQVRHPYLDKESILEYKEILFQLSGLQIDKEIKEIYQSFEQQEYYQELKKLLNKNIDVNILKESVDKFLEMCVEKEDSDVSNDMDLKAALNYSDRSKGLLWRCQALREHFNGGLIQGDFGIIAGYVDTGKSSFIASELSYMGTQLSNDESILWLSNEGSFMSLLPRLYCAAIGCTETDLRKYLEKAESKYVDLMKGNRNRILIKDIQGWSNKDVEKLIKNVSPRLIVIDLLDHIQGFDGRAEFERYNKLYQWAREIATKYCPILGVSQMNGDSEDDPYAPMSKLRGSRVDKQAAATFQLHIGAKAGNNTVRYLSMPKNKINSNKSWRVSVKFDAERSRFE